MTSSELSLTVDFQNPSSDVGPEIAGEVAAGVVGAAMGSATGGGAGVGRALGSKGRKMAGTPYFAVDGVEHVGNWAAPTRVGIAPGDHKVEVYYRLKGVPIKRCKGNAKFTVSDTDVSVHAFFGQMVTTTTVSSRGRPDVRHKRLNF